MNGHGDTSEPIYAIVDYEDPYVQPLLLEALHSRLPPELLIMIDDVSHAPDTCKRLLQWRQYETIDFELLMQRPASVLANSYVIRKALIRKHYLSTTVSHWLSKHPESVLKRHVKPSVEFEVDYAEFLDDALVEAYELKESWDRNEQLPPERREWWILKPGMSDRGQGIRLFSSEEELNAIFAEWDPESDDEDNDLAGRSDSKPRARQTSGDSGEGNGIVTSQLRHFVAQPYIHLPLLFTAPFESARRKFHIRTYVLAVGALKLYVYKPMLALFAARPYSTPASASSPNDALPAHLTNTCLQSGQREGSVHAFWSLPNDLPEPKGDWKQSAFDQICTMTGEVFEAAARSMGIYFQPLPNAFEIFGVDFLVDAEGTAWLLEVNAFPDFAQTGEELGPVVSGLFEGVVDCAVAPFFGLDRAHLHESKGNHADMVKVLDIDLGRR